jgi:myo-inositol-1(or 4)-monophosphatase
MTKGLFTQSDFDFFIKLTNTAGIKALTFQKETIKVQRKKDSTIVTEADYFIQDLIISEISGKYPHFNFIHEENCSKSGSIITDDTVSIIIDPIDGTAMFSMYLPIWCVSIGVFKGFEPVYGFVYSPGSDMFFYTDDDNSYLNGAKLTVDKNMRIDSETNIFCSSETAIRGTEFPGKIRNLGSTALHACLTADNRRNRLLAFIGQSFLWDWAGAIPVILKAGGSIKYLNGSEINIKKIIENGYALEQNAVAYNSNNFESVKSYFAY